MIALAQVQVDPCWWIWPNKAIVPALPIPLTPRPSLFPLQLLPTLAPFHPSLPHASTAQYRSYLVWQMSSAVQVHVGRLWLSCQIPSTIAACFMANLQQLVPVEDCALKLTRKEHDHLWYLFYHPEWNYYSAYSDVHASSSEHSLHAPWEYVDFRLQHTHCL